MAECSECEEEVEHIILLSFSHEGQVLDSIELCPDCAKDVAKACGAYLGPIQNTPSQSSDER